MGEQLANQYFDNQEDQRLIQSLFRIPDRYLRSIQIERDFHDTELLEQYILTPPMERSLTRIVEGLRQNSGRRAWRITGDYGSGKSSFALFLAHLLNGSQHSKVSSARTAIENANPNLFQPIKLIPILVTGAREGLVSAIARGILWTLDWIQSYDESIDILASNRERAIKVIESQDTKLLIDLITDFSNTPGYSGLLLILDEMGKFLEYAALYPDREDVYILQQLAETAARSGKRPIVLIGLLHQGFHAYAERLPSTARHEWEKVAGRFDEIVFDQPLTHIVTLVSNALNICKEELPQVISSTIDTIVKSTIATGWYGATGSVLNELNLINLYPLHPTVLPVIVNFFSRFGQHERSLFSFLLSSEPFGLQNFAQRPVYIVDYYRLSNFYDYIRANFGHRLAGASFRSHWLRIVDILDSVETSSEVELNILKTVAVLNLIDAEQLLATDVAIVATAFDNDPNGEIITTINSLKDKGLLHKRGTAGGYRLWSTTSINLEARFEDAKRALGPIEHVSLYLKDYLKVPPLLARRHYIKTGTLRYFEIRYADLALLRDIAHEPTDADGLIIVALCDTSAQQISAKEYAQEPETASRADLLIAVPFPLIGLRNEVQDARCWNWVKHNAPELIDDIYAANEVSREMTASSRILQKRLTALINFGDGYPDMQIEWWRLGRQIPIEPQQGILPNLSKICDELYNEAPSIKNELLNRSILSSPAANARLRLIERMLEGADKPLLSIDQYKAPPEKSMYLSVLKAGLVHREINGHYVIEEPEEGNDPLNLRPSLFRIINILETAKEQRVSVLTIFNALTSKPYGVRQGVIPLLLAIIVIGHAHELAIYENGTFLSEVKPSHFLRLIKAPGTFELQMVKVVGIRGRLFKTLVDVFAITQTADKEPELLDVVKSFIMFVAGLPEYSKRTEKLSSVTIQVRSTLFKAQEPKPLLFKHLPEACGLAEFSTEDILDTKQTDNFVTALQLAFNELRNAYPLLLERIRQHIASALGESRSVINRERIVSRAANVAVAAAETRLRTFALRLADTKLTDDAWTEAIGSFVIAKPVRNWIPGDEKKATEEIEALCSTFQRLEAITFASSESTRLISAVRVGLTHSNGIETMQIVQVKPELEAEIHSKVTELQDFLPDSEELRLAILVQLLEQSLKKKKSEEQNL